MRAPRILVAALVALAAAASAAYGAPSDVPPHGPGHGCGHGHGNQGSCGHGSHGNGHGNGGCGHGHGNGNSCDSDGDGHGGHGHGQGDGHGGGSGGGGGTGGGPGGGGPGGGGPGTPGGGTPGGGTPGGGTPGGPGGSGGTGAGAAQGVLGVTASDTTAPAFLVRPRLHPTRFRAARRRGPSIATSVGTTITYTLSEAARVTFTVQKYRPLSRICRRRLATVTRHRTGPRCRRWISLRGRFAKASAAGPNSVRFTGRLRRRPLRPGRYRLVIRARDASGNVTRPRRPAFRIVR